MRQGFRDMLFSLGMLGVAGLLWWETSRPKYQADKLQDSGFDPAFFPRIMLGLWVIIGVALLVRSFKSWTVPAEAQNWPKLIGSLVLVAFYAAAINYLGFLFASIPFMALFVALLGFRRPVVLLVVAVLFPLITWYTFVHLLSISLPVSPWFTRM